MTPTGYSEDTLVQQTTTDYLKNNLDWDSVYAYNQETFGCDGLLGRNSDREVVLTRYLKKALKEFNPGLPETAYNEAVRQVVEYSQSQSMLSPTLINTNCSKTVCWFLFKVNMVRLKKRGSRYLTLTKRITITF